ncbi:hypothetical protein CEXT_642001 [Caerostris extrusa]|uniref:Secreted protein n=1 Tax=Caerostris extrusa TaxID=172846 RepID=A0AAV4Q4H2_CAEEX|nr:hypothetical protein CEXT_642001 [Caerostris extrusa]
MFNYVISISQIILVASVGVGGGLCELTVDELLPPLQRNHLDGMDEGSGYMIAIKMTSPSRMRGCDRKTVWLIFHVRLPAVVRRGSFFESGGCCRCLQFP